MSRRELWLNESVEIKGFFSDSEQKQDNFKTEQKPRSPTFPTSLKRHRCGTQPQPSDWPGHFVVLWGAGRFTTVDIYRWCDMKTWVWGASATDLQHYHEEKVEVGHSLELLKQRHGQESQAGVLVAAHQIVLTTNKTMQSAAQTHVCCARCQRVSEYEAGRAGSSGMRLTDCRPQRKHKRDFFCLFLWYWRLLARTSHVNPAKNA